MIVDIVIAFAIVASIGLIAGVLLALASHFLHVPQDEKVQRLRECLPGVNCGACGYTGCDEYAKAVAAGEAKTNLCVPGADAVSKEISDIMGVAFEDVVEMIAHVRCNGNCEATSKRAMYDGVASCRAASLIYGGPNACRFGCLGCGDCASSCPVNAICMKDGIAHIDERTCLGCGLCVSLCPKNIIEIIPRISRVAVMCSNTEKGAVARKQCTNACIGCKKCELNCPQKAIVVENNLARIDYDKCTGCGICAEKCPTHCIRTLCVE